MQTIYNKLGGTKTLDTVDAREHVSSGRWFYDLPVVEDKPKEIKAAEVKSVVAKLVVEDKPKEIKAAEVKKDIEVSSKE